MDTGYGNPYVVAQSEASVRAGFIRKTYLHLAGAILVFAALEAILLNSAWSVNLAVKILSTGGMGWLVVLGLFMVVSVIADRWAQSNTSRGMQYLGLGLFIVAEAIVFLPLLVLAAFKYSSVQGAPDWTIIRDAGVVTALLFAGLTAFALITKSDFSFMRGFLMIAGFVAMGVIVASLLFGFQLGTLFSGIMVLFAAGSILYTTSNILHHYRPEQHVAASLALFSAVALMFWYILRIFMSRD
ncbi:MAG: FtsH-binding integral membrane protein [Verrucomicrobiales bacterium]|jgi:FtsH-binding integral membrane protein